MKSALISDDERVIRMNLKEMLQGFGFEQIFETADGEAAVRAAIDKFPDVIILDISMPKLDGISAAIEIRKKLKVPIILLTACHDPVVIKRAVKAGIAAFLTKPARAEELWPAIELAFAHNDQLENLKEQVDDLKETMESRKVIERAKGVLMKRDGLAEPDAFRKMQRLAMDKRKSLRQIAEAILLSA